MCVYNKNSYLFFGYDKNRKESLGIFFFWFSFYLDVCVQYGIGIIDVKFEFYWINKQSILL